MKKITDIRFQEIASIPHLIKDFLSGELMGFEDDIFNLQNVQLKMDTKEKCFTPHQRTILVQALERQLSGTLLSTKQKEHFENLKEERCFTVTTGHQLNLFTGPVFFIYKIIQTIKTAEYLKTHFPEYSFVPIFWMASEDHDFQEINHFKTREAYYETNAEAGGAVGRMVISERGFIDAFEAEFENTEYGPKLIEWLREAYAPGNTLSQATRILGQHLFGDYGLLMLDGDDVALKSEMIPIFQKELESQQLKAFTAAQREFLEQNYSKVQVNPRDINLFYLSETRNRIDYDGTNYYLIDTPIKMSRGEILAELHSHPERFSPNALMRPVYQELILPNIAYIGGNAEIMYWAELKEYFHSLDLPFPILIPRNSMLFVPQKVRRKMENLQLEVRDFFGDFTSVINLRLMQDNKLQELLNKNKFLLEASFKELKDQSALTDKSFRNLVEAEETRQLKSYSRMEKRLLRAEKIKHQDVVARMNSLYGKIHPGGLWQERVLNFSVFFSEYGHEWIRYTYNQMDVENSKLIMVQV